MKLHEVIQNTSEKEFKILMIKITEMKRKFSSWVTVSYARPYLRLNNTDLNLLVSFIKIILFNQLGPYMIYTQWYCIKHD